LKDQTYPDTAE